MNTLDWIIIAIIVISALTGYRKGFIYTVFKTISSIIAVLLSYVGYRPINILLRNIGLYNWLKNIVLKVTFSGQEPATLYEQARLIHELNLPIPNSIKNGIIHNNNPEIYSILGVNNFKEYIGGYIANFYLNIVSFIVVYFVVRFVLHIVGGGLHIISKLPIIRFADQWAGLGIGVIQGAMIIWISIMIVTILVGFPKFEKISLLLSEGMLARWFYENNIILQMIDKIFI